MNESEFSGLLTKVKQASEVVNAFSSEAVQLQVTNALLQALLSASGLPNGDQSSGNIEDGNSDAETGRRRRRPARRAASAASAESVNFDALSVANAVKQHAQFDLFKRKIILGKTPRSNRVKFVSWFIEDTPLTSGNIQRVLQNLGVKMDPATASRGLSDAKDDYIKSEDGPQPTYALTARGREEFGKWLLVEPST